MWIEKTKKLREVVHVEEVGLACQPGDAALIKRGIGEQGLNRIVIAGCSHREIRSTMEEMARGMGFNPTLIEYANIREQCAFVHQDYPELATQKAMALITMAVERARRLQAIQRGSQKVEKTGVVVGGGLTGMSASLRLAEQGYDGSLIEKGKELGGNLKSPFIHEGVSAPNFVAGIGQKGGRLLLYTAAFRNRGLSGLNEKMGITEPGSASEEKKRFWIMGRYGRHGWQRGFAERVFVR